MDPYQQQDTPIKMLFFTTHQHPLTNHTAQKERGFSLKGHTTGWISPTDTKNVRTVTK